MRASSSRWTPTRRACTRFVVGSRTVSDSRRSFRTGRRRFRGCRPGPMRVGDEVVVTRFTGPAAVPFVAITEPWRVPLLGLVAAVFAAPVPRRRRHARARSLVALALTLTVVVKLVVPLLLRGFDPILLAVGVAAAVTLVTLLDRGLPAGSRWRRRWAPSWHSPSRRFSPPSSPQWLASPRSRATRRLRSSSRSSASASTWTGSSWRRRSASAWRRRHRHAGGNRRAAHQSDRPRPAPTSCTARDARRPLAHRRDREHAGPGLPRRVASSCCSSP